MTWYGITRLCGIDKSKLLLSDPISLLCALPLFFHSDPKLIISYLGFQLHPQYTKSTASHHHPLHASFPGDVCSLAEEPNAIKAASASLTLSGPFEDSAGPDMALESSLQGLGGGCGDSDATDSGSLFFRVEVADGSSDDLNEGVPWHSSFDNDRFGADNPVNAFFRRRTRRRTLRQ